METIALVVYWVSDPSQAEGLLTARRAVCMWAGHPVLNDLVLRLYG